MRSSRPCSEELRVGQVRFLAEQDGPPERILKQGLVELFRHDRTVSRAYLVRVSFGDESKIGVVLGLERILGPNRDIVEDVGAVFAKIFGRGQHLDIMFLSGQQQKELNEVCQPFFEQSPE